MANWFYTDASGQKQGPIDAQQMKTLAAQGIITRETVIENEQGKSALAEKVKGLTFPEPPASAPATSAPAAPVQPTKPAVPLKVSVPLQEEKTKETAPSVVHVPQPLEHPPFVSPSDSDGATLSSALSPKSFSKPMILGVVGGVLFLLLASI